jgi:AraC family transcriptional regulator of adaptative response/methylated-DNA-[protein]-cysteine methyltransferase
MLKQHIFQTSLGEIITIANEKKLFLLDFTDSKKLKREIIRLTTHLQTKIYDGKNEILMFIKKELDDYLKGDLKTFKTPIEFLGTPFQKSVWQTLQKIPYGKTWSYAELANAIEKPTAYRAVANANGANSLSIIVPCHRVINSDGSFGGYASGVSRKMRLLEIEELR